MNGTHDATPNGAGNPNQETIDELRAAITFLENHPELPLMRAWIHATVDGDDAREQLTRFASLFGERATETESYGDVKIRTTGARVSLEVRASVRQLGGRQVQFEYEPIIAREAVAA